MAIASSIITIFNIAPVQASNLIQNGSFENINGTFSYNRYGGMQLNPGSTVIPGWTTTNGELAWLDNSNPWGIRTPFDSFFLELTGYTDRPPYGGVTQNIDTVVGGQYTLSMSLGLSNPSYRGPISVTATAGSSSQTFTFNSSEPGNQWGDFSLDFTGTHTSTPISIIGTSTANGYYFGLDNVSVVKSVPEPLTILGTGTAIAFGATFKRKLAKTKSQKKKS
ncbi:MAG: PEP-CTERM sorting domain-containing protein [Crocosphaera sp.]